MFGRDDANVYFNQDNVGIAVGNMLSIPVTMANIPGGPAVAVGFTINDSTAVEGVDYEILSSNPFVFPQGHGTEYIVIKTLVREVDSQSRRFFSIKLDPVDGFRANNRDSIMVELRNYSNHPLAHLLGDAQMSGYDYMSGPAEFPVNIYPDDKNDLQLYLSGVTGGATFGGIIPDLKMTVDTTKHKIYITSEIFSDCTLGSVSGNIETVRGEVVSNGIAYGSNPITCTYDDNGNIYFNDWFGALWASGDAQGQWLFFYYGYYSNAYRTAITR